MTTTSSPPPLTGLFLGAGASCELGMPLVWELTRELKDWLTPEKLRGFNLAWHAQGGGHSTKVIDDLVAILSMQDLHYESILGNLEVHARRPGRPSNETQEYWGLYAWLVEMVYFMLSLKHNDQFAASIPRIDGMARLAKKHAPLWVFSTNHDLAIECLCALHGVPLNCGFSPSSMKLPTRNAQGAQIGELSVEVLGEQQIARGGIPFFQPGVAGINLLKLHGSLDVFAFRDGKDLLRVLPAENTPSGVLRALKSANEELLYFDPNAPRQRVKATNEIAYADASGEMQFLRRTLLSGAFKFDGRNTQVMPERMLDHLRANINYVTRLVSIGYGFGDVHINQVLRQWLEFSAARQLEIVGPGLKSIPAPLLHVGPQLTLRDSKAGDYLASC